ncbi:DUF1905 domain-containing protein [Nocardia sp. NPDC051030]|uniref:DUF1905 domain-containing protein n=1 Tax=Nocardia sp. NPDC051030 TaxID=3155162 RepID=UPI0034449267
MVDSRYSFSAELWVWEGPAAWYFVNLPEGVADEIEELFGQRAGGFGSVRVKVEVGESRWATSIFPSKKHATYMLPMKKTVREAEGLSVGDSVRIALTIV